MHYATALKNENDALKGRLETTSQEITNLAAYLLSDKFWTDTTVQTADVLRRLEDIRSHLNSDLGNWHDQTESRTTHRLFRQVSQEHWSVSRIGILSWGIRWNKESWTTRIVRSPMGRRRRNEADDA